MNDPRLPGPGRRAYPGRDSTNSLDRIRSRRTCFEQSSNNYDETFHSAVCYFQKCCQKRINGHTDWLLGRKHSSKQSRAQARCHGNGRQSTHNFRQQAQKHSECQRISRGLYLWVLTFFQLGTAFLSECPRQSKPPPPFPLLFLAVQMIYSTH